jgi:hypothetical protein
MAVGLRLAVQFLSLIDAGGGMGGSWSFSMGHSIIYMVAFRCNSFISCRGIWTWDLSKAEGGWVLRIPPGLENFQPPGHISYLDLQSKTISIGAKKLCNCSKNSFHLDPSNASMKQKKPLDLLHRSKIGLITT